MQRIGYLAFRIVVFLISITPFFVLYLISDLLALLFYHVIRYRKKMILENLSKSFPDLSDKEIRKICRQSYQNLSDILVEGIKGLTMSGKEIKKRYVVHPNANMDACFERGQSIVGATAHMTNWEWGVASCGLSLKHHILGVYKRLSQPYINNYIFGTRDRVNVTLSEMKETTDNMKSGNVKTPYILMLIADQRPADPYKAYWTNFLNRDTAFLYGIEKFSLEYQLPVFFFNIRRIKRGFYEVDVLDLCLDPSAVQKGDIIKKYAEILGSEIEQRPADWLWSHSRWKHPKPDDFIQG